MPINVINSLSLSEHRDLRSTSVPYKRVKDHVEKQSQYVRLSSNSLIYSGGDIKENMNRKTDEMRIIKSQLSKPWNSNLKTNKMAKSGWSTNKVNGRSTARHYTDINDTDSSIPELSHSQASQLSYDDNKINTIYTTNLEPDIQYPLYSFDNKGPSPGVNGHNVELEKLVELAEKKWEARMVEKMVEGEYEILDVKGENVTLTKKSKRNQKHKSKALPIQGSNEAVDEDDGFELI